MKLLAIETSSQACSVALLADEKITQKHQILNNQHSQFLLSYIDELLVEASISKSQLDAIAVGNGPGSFTGLRLGMGVAQGLAYGLNKPLIPISSLLSVAAQCEEQYLLVAVDARMGEVYWQCLEQINQKNFISLTQPNLNKPADLVLPSINGDWYGIGSGWDVYSEQLGRCLQDEDDWRGEMLPRGSQIAKLAQVKISSDDVDLDQQALPVYVRNQVVS